MELPVLPGGLLAKIWKRMAVMMVEKEKQRKERVAAGEAVVHSGCRAAVTRSTG